MGLGVLWGLSLTQTALGSGHDPAAPTAQSPIQPVSSPAESNPPAMKRESAIRLNGFIDSQYLFNTTQSLHRGFVINDGAIYVAGENAGLDWKLDLPFRMTGSGNSGFRFAESRGTQAYLGQKFAGGWKWKIGQYDSPFGLESNDTADIPFSRQGSVYYSMMPYVHTGLGVGYDFSDSVGMNAFFQNPNDRGVLGGNGVQYGFQFVLNQPKARFSAGVLMDTPAGLSQNVFADATGGFTLGAFTADLEFCYSIRNDLLNPETAAASNGIGVLGQLLYNHTDELSFGVRGEYVTQFAVTDVRSTASQTALKSQILVFAGPQYYLTKNIRLKGDYSLQLDQPFNGGASVLLHGAQIGAVFRF